MTLSNDQCLKKKSLIKFLMNNQLSSGKEQNSAATMVKSSKVLNSVANLHLRTESNNHEESRSPQRGQPEFRQTWRRPRMPYNKLPDAFQIKQKKKKSNKDLLDNLDRIVKINEYKEIQKLLDPISLEKRHEEKPRQSSANPLVTIHKYFKMESRFREKMQEGQRSSQKLKTISTKQSSLRITDCITLEVIKHRHLTGTVKKMLYVPTLKLMSAREQPLSTKDQRVTLKTWLQFWQHNLNNFPQFLTLQGFLFNVPEGAISVITDYCGNGSLLDLLDSVFTLSESVIREVFFQVFQGMQAFYRVTADQITHFGGLSASQILFDSDGKVKIGLGLFYQLSLTPSTLFGLRSQSKANPFDMNSTQRNFMKYSQNQLNQEIDRSLDVFKLGVMMLECAIGGLSNFEQSALIHEALKNIFTEEGQKMIERENVCCLIHSEAFLLENMSQQDQRSRRDRIDISKVTPYIKFLKDRFSMPFLNFLCCCLKLVHTQRSRIEDLINHSFLRNEGYKDTKTVHITLNDLLMINSGWNQDLLESIHEEQGQKLVSHILHILSDCSRETILALLKNQKEKILNIGKYVGMNWIGMGEKLFAAMMQLSHPQRDFNTSI